jgi:hypothetical protein
LPKGLKVYAPVHFLALLIYKTRSLRTAPTEALLKTLISLGHSLAFASGYISLVKISECYTARFFNGYTPLGYFIVTIIATHGLYFEAPHRRKEMCLALLPRSIEFLWNIAKTAHLVKPLPHGEVVLLMAALGLMCSLYQCEPQYLANSYASGLAKLLGDN